MRIYYSDYDYLYEFFEDKEMLDKFMRDFNGIELKVDLHEHNRFLTQKKLIDGVSPSDIAKELDMNRQTVYKIRERMIKGNLIMYAVRDDSDQLDLRRLNENR